MMCLNWPQILRLKANKQMDCLPFFYLAIDYLFLADSHSSMGNIIYSKNVFYFVVQMGLEPTSTRKTLASYVKGCSFTPLDDWTIFKHWDYMFSTDTFVSLSSVCETEVLHLSTSPWEVYQRRCLILSGGFTTVNVRLLYVLNSPNLAGCSEALTS